MKTAFALNTPTRVITFTEYDESKPKIEVLMENDNGAILLLMLKKGQRLPEHLAPEDVMVHSVQGEVEFVVEGQEKRLFDGDAMFMKKGTSHSVHALTDTQILITKIKP